MKKLVVTLLLLPTLSFSQEIIGKWAKNTKSGTALEFKADGTFNMFRVDNPEQTLLRNFTATYTVFTTNNEDYIEQNFYIKDKLVKQDKLKYKLENGILYLPRTVITNGVEAVEEYADAYIKIE